MEEEDVEDVEEVQTPSRKRKRRDTSFVWNYMEKVENGGSVCLVQECSRNRKPFKTQNTATLNRHLSNQHGITKTESEELSKFTLRERIVDWITISLMPLNVLDCKEFRSLFPIDIPSVDTFAGDIRRKFKVEKLKVSQQLASAEGKISFTCDIWTSKAPKSFFGITAHWITNYKLGA